MGFPVSSFGGWSNSISLYLDNIYRPDPLPNKLFGRPAPLELVSPRFSIFWLMDDSIYLQIDVVYISQLSHLGWRRIYHQIATSTWTLIIANWLTFHRILGSKPAPAWSSTPSTAVQLLAGAQLIFLSGVIVHLKNAPPFCIQDVSISLLHSS